MLAVAVACIVHQIRLLVIQYAAIDSYMFENAVDAEHATTSAHHERRRRALNVLYAIS